MVLQAETIDNTGLLFLIWVSQCFFKEAFGIKYSILRAFIRKTAIKLENIEN